MSRETDGIRAIPVLAGVPHVVTDLTTPGVHTAYNPPKTHGAHYAPATWAQPIALDRSKGDVGLAVDFAHKRGDGKQLTPELMAIWQCFAALGKAGKLQELFYAGADYCVYGGKWQLWTGLGKATRDKIKNAHKSHVHISVRKGTFLAPAPPAVTAAASYVAATAIRKPPAQIPDKTTDYGDIPVKRIDIHIPQLDAQGCGWKQLEIDPASVVSIVGRGSYPPADGYWNNPIFNRQDRGGSTIVTITEGTPLGEVFFTVWTV